MDTEKIKTFNVVMGNNGNFSLSADMLNLTQSSVSKHIKALEKEFEIELFVRRNAKSFPTKAVIKDLHVIGYVNLVANHSIDVQRFFNVPLIVECLLDDKSCSIIPEKVISYFNFPNIVTVPISNLNPVDIYVCRLAATHGVESIRSLSNYLLTNYNSTFSALRKNF